MTTPWFNPSPEVKITAEDIEAALKLHFKCSVVKKEVKFPFYHGEAIQVRHPLDLVMDQMGMEPRPWLNIDFRRILFDEEEQWVACIWSSEDETGDAHQYLIGAALCVEMIAAALYFAR